MKKLFKSEPIRGKIIAAITEKTKSDVNFEEIEVYLIPAPHIKVYKGSFNIEANYKTICNYKSLDIYPKIIPLFRREIKLKQITLNNPKFLISLPEKLHEIPDVEQDEQSFLFYFEKYYKDLVTIASKFPLIELQINNGELVLFKEGKEVLNMHKVKTSYQFSKNLIKVKFSTSSDFAKSINLKARISTTDYKAGAEINFDNLDPRFLSGVMLKDSVYRIGNSELDLELLLKIDGLRKISGDIESPKFSLNLINNDELFNIKGRNLNGSFHIDDSKQLYSVKEVNLSNPKLSLSAEFQSDKKNKKNSLKIKGDDVDIETTRKMALFSLNKYEITEKIFQVLKAGEFETIQFNSESKNSSKLFKEKNFNLKGTIKNGAISVPEFDLNFKNVNGNASLKDGVLNGTNLFGKIDSSTLGNGTLILGLGKNKDIFKLNSDIDGNLQELRQNLIRLVKNESFLKFLSSLENLNGNASGNLILGDKKSLIKAKVNVNKFNLTVNYPKIPYEVKLAGNDLLYEESYISFRNVNGNISKTKFTNLTGKYDWGIESNLEIESLNSNISMDELYNWISSFDKLSDYLKQYKEASGNINIQDLHFSRQASNPDNWELEFKSDGTIYNEEKLNYSLNFIKTPGIFKIENLKLKDENSDAELSLVFNDKSYQIDFSGRLAEKTTDQYLTDFALSFGWIEGDISFKYFMNEISNSTAVGNLKGGKIVFPFKENNPIKIEAVSLNAKENTIKIEAMDLLIEEHKVNISGSLYSVKDKIGIDLDATANELEWDGLKRYFEGPDSEEEKTNTGSSSKLPIEGTIKVDLSKFSYGELIWEPFQGEISLSQEKVNLVVNKSSVCNVSTTGNFEIKDSYIDMDFDAISENKKIENTLSCFFDMKTKTITGNYDLQADIYSNGNISKIRENLNGEYTLNVKDGTFPKDHPMLLAILKITNITEIYRGGLPDFSAEGLDFSTIDIKGEIEEGVIKFRDATLESPYVRIIFGGYINISDEKYDIKFRVAVLKTVQDVLKKVPIVKSLKAERIMSIPVRVKGEFNKPETMQYQKE